MKPVSGNEKILFESKGTSGNNNVSDELMVTNRRLYLVDKTMNAGTCHIIDVEDVKKVSFGSQIKNKRWLSFFMIGIFILFVGISLGLFYDKIWGGVIATIGGFLTLIGILLYQTKGWFVISHTGGEIKINLTNPNLMQIRDAIFLAKDEILKK